jgi:hypothetical protein
MPEPYDKTVFSPWGLFRGENIYWIGMAENERDAWVIGLGWPSEEEIADCKSQGILASPVTLTKHVQRREQ